MKLVPDVRWTPDDVAEGLGVPLNAVYDWIALRQLVLPQGVITDRALHAFLWRYPLAGRSRTRNRPWVEGLLWGCDVCYKEPPDVRARRRAAQATQQEARAA